jgi:hypothetical protein
VGQLAGFPKFKSAEVSEQVSHQIKTVWLAADMAYVAV